MKSCLTFIRGYPRAHQGAAESSLTVAEKKSVVGSFPDRTLCPLKKGTAATIREVSLDHNSLKL